MSPPAPIIAASTYRLMTTAAARCHHRLYAANAGTATSHAHNETLATPTTAAIRYVSEVLLKGSKDRRSSGRGGAAGDDTHGGVRRRGRPDRTGAGMAIP